MSGLVKTYRKTVVERRRLYLDYSCFLEEDEVLSSFQVTVIPYTAEAPMSVSSSYPDSTHKKLMLFIAGGAANQAYTLQMVVNTDQGQIKQDNIGFMVTPT